MNGNNALDIANWAFGLGDKCPTLAAIQAALAAQPPAYAKQGDVVYPGVTLVDATNGLVALDPAQYGSKFAGQMFCAAPLLSVVDPKGQASATIEWNSSSAQLADQTGWLYVRVCAMQHQDVASRPWIPGKTWIPNAWSVGSEYGNWEAVVDHLVNHWNPPTQGKQP